MKIFSTEFTNWINRNTVCKLLGHKASDWMREEWAPAHGTGFEVKLCDRCNKELGRRGRSQYAEMEWSV